MTDAEREQLVACFETLQRFTASGNKAVLVGSHSGRFHIGWGRLGADAPENRVSGATLLDAFAQFAQAENFNQTADAQERRR